MLIAGLGGNCKDELIDILRRFNKDEVAFYTDIIDDINIPFFKKHGLNVLVGKASAAKYFSEVDNRFISMIGNNQNRQKQVIYLEKLGGKPSSYISNAAMVNESLAEISKKNVIIMHFANFSAGSKIEEGAIVYSYTAIAHDVHIGKYAFISAHCAISNSVVGEYTFVGLNTMIGPGVQIGKNCVIGANSYVKNDLPDYTVAVGSPAKIIKKIQHLEP